MANKKKVQFKNDDANLVSVSLNDMDNLPFHNEEMDERDFRNSKGSTTLDKNQVDPEPADSNSMEPSLTSIHAPVAQPPPLHCNTSSLRHSSAPVAMNDTTKTLQQLSSPAATTPTPPLSSSASVNSAVSASSFPKNATTTVEFVLESPDLHAIEMQYFGNRSDKNNAATALENPSTVPQVSRPEEAHSAQPPSSQNNNNNFFTGWFTIPPSLAGRPRLTEQQEQFVKREFERGPVPLMWPKEADLENQGQDWRNNTTHVRQMSTGQEPLSSGGGSGGWFRSWGFGTPSKGTEARTEGTMAQ
ncbi:hypothetical protein BGZ70_006538 [Mortierella alpina]|uniref:Uncharacterized protein n=1 Tax=Mortierella alpina TaxID=64518 RepID=A0A9P6M3U0_MORAP|nr:hypothetical protein BGZ70_006538 [Mortierella alpina]